MSQVPTESESGLPDSVPDQTIYRSTDSRYSDGGRLALRNYGSNAQCKSRETKLDKVVLVIINGVRQLAENKA